MKLSRESVQPGDGASFARLDFDLDQFDARYHYHPEIEITLIVDSEGQRLVGDALENFGPGDLILIGANVPHQYRNWQVGRARSRVVQFDRALFGPALFELPEFSRVRNLLDRSARGLDFSPEVKRRGRTQLERLFSASEGPDSVIELLALLSLLSSEKRPRPIASAAYSQPLKLKKIDRLQRVLNYLEGNWREPIRLEDVARVAALHPQSVSRFFQQHLGTSFQAYLVQLRLGRAARLLLETDRTVVDIAFYCGFNNLANFNRHFQKAYGRTPSAYRSTV